jgi:hypothetical protein
VAGEVSAEARTSGAVARTSGAAAGEVSAMTGDVLRTSGPVDDAPADGSDIVLGADRPQPYLPRGRAAARQDRPGPSETPTGWM